MKKSIALFLSCVMILSGVFVGYAAGNTLSHNDVCDQCKHTGDMDQNGILDLDDPIYLLYHLNFPERYPLAGCEYVDYDPDAPVEPPQGGDAVYDSEIKNLNGHEFRFIVKDSTQKHLSVNEVYAEALNGDKVNDAVFARNKKLSEMYNCSIVEGRLPNVYSGVLEPLLAGEYLGDYLLSTPEEMRRLAEANLLVDLSVLDNIDLEKAWWDQDTIPALNVGGKTFFVNGDGCTLDERAMQIVLFNKDWVEEYAPELDLYDEVRAGRWTIDMMYQLMVSTAKDLDGDGCLVPGYDRFGYIGGQFNNWAHVSTVGGTLSRISSYGEYEIPAQPKAELLNIWETLRPLLTSPCRLVEDGIGKFHNGLSTFYIGNLGTLLSPSNSSIAFGALPLPKLNTAQENYYTTASYDQMGCFAIPASVANAEDYSFNGFSSGREQAAYFLEAFNYYSKLILTPAFFDQVVLKQAVRDEDSAEMIRIAMENKVYDPVVGYDFGKMLMLFYEVGSPNAEAPGSDAAYDTFVSTYESRYTAARKALYEYLTSINTEAV